jgi:uncharacterized protein
MRVVIDTNVFISSFLGKGNPYKIIELWKTGAVTLCLSTDILSEYVEVLERLSLSGEPEIRELLDLFKKSSQVVFTANPEKLSVVDIDPDENMFFECAASLHADYIITGDKAVRRIGKYLQILVLTPREFIDQFDN